LRPTAAPALPTLHVELVELELELQQLEAGLKAEKAAIEELKAALEASKKKGANAKEVYVALKLALNTGKAAVDTGLLPELAGLIADVEKAIEAKEKEITKMQEEEAKKGGGKKESVMDLLEAEVANKEGARDEAREAKQKALEEELESLSMAANGDEASVEQLTVKVRNGVDFVDEQPIQLKGYNPDSMGLTFNEENAVSGIRRGGLASRDNELRVGDIILAVNGEALQGAKLQAVLDKKPLGEYTLRVARYKNLDKVVSEEGDHCSWLMVVKAKDGAALAYQYARKTWMVLTDDQIELREGRRRAPRTVNLLGSTQCKTPVTASIGGKKLDQPPVVKEFMEQRRFPFTLHWPNGEVDHDIVCAAPTSKDRAAWTKVINAVLKRKQQQQKGKEDEFTSGWLVKQGGRKSGRIALSHWRKRWFHLDNPSKNRSTGDLADEAPSQLRFYTDPPRKGEKQEVKGIIELNSASRIFITDKTNKPHCFCLTTQAKSDRAPITTVLAATTNDEMSKWMNALNAAIIAVGGKPAKGLKTRMAPKSSSTARLTLGGSKKSIFGNSSSTADFEQLSHLSREELQELKIPMLKKILDHFDVDYDLKSKDVSMLANNIVSHRKLLDQAKKRVSRY
jgi:hypothetical protein